MVKRNHANSDIRGQSNASIRPEFRICNNNVTSLLGVKDGFPYHYVFGIFKIRLLHHRGHNSLLQNKVTWTASFVGDNMFIIHWLQSGLGQPINLPLSLRLCVCAFVRATRLNVHICVSHFILCNFNWFKRIHANYMRTIFNLTSLNIMSVLSCYPLSEQPAIQLHWVYI